MNNKWDGNKWLKISYRFLCGAVLSTVLLIMSWFDLNPWDKPAGYYQEQVPARQRMLVVALAVPLVAALAAVLSIFAGSRSRPTLIGALVILTLATAATWFCGVIGIDAVQSAKAYAELYGS